MEIRKVNINPQIEYQTSPPMQKPPEGLDGYAILYRNGNGNLVFESLNGYKVPVYTSGGIQKVTRDKSGMIGFFINLVGAQVNRLGQSSTDSIVMGENTKVYVRQEDGSLVEYTEVENETDQPNGG